MCLPTKRRIGHDNVKLILLHLLACTFIVPFARSGEGIALEYINGTITVHDEIHLRGTDKKRVDVHTEKIAFR